MDKQSYFGLNEIYITISRWEPRSEHFLLQTAQAELDKYKQKFNDIKSQQEDKIKELQQTLDRDHKELTRMISRKEDLSTEVETLETIRDVLPSWCRDGNGNENGNGR